MHAPFTLVQLVAPNMEVRGGGRILNVTTGSAECFRQPEEPPVVESAGDFSLLMPAYFSSKRALDRFANVMTPVLASKNIFIISVMPGLAASPIAEHRVKAQGLDPTMMVPMSIPARMLTYFAACEDPKEYVGRIFWAEREMTELGLSGVGSFARHRLSQRIDWKREAETTGALLERLGADIRQSRPVASLTARERSIVAIARALRSQRDGEGVIILDEATRALSRGELTDSHRTLRRVIEQGGAAVLVSHKVEAASGGRDGPAGRGPAGHARTARRGVAEPSDPAAADLTATW